jgi:hypothetical protein
MKSSEFDTDLLGLTQEMAPVVPKLLSLLRPLRLGWLKHRNIGISRGIEPVSDSDIAAVTRKRKKRLALDPELYCQNINCPEFLEDVYDFPDGNFTLLHKGRAIGMGFKQTDAQGNVSLFWIKRSDLVRFAHEWQRRLFEACSASQFRRSATRSIRSCAFDPRVVCTVRRFRAIAAGG